MREYVRLNMENQQPVMALMSIKKMVEQLPVNSFMRVHRPFVVNLNKITTVERNCIIFDNKTHIPVSDQYKASFQQYLDEN
jgi:two-component system LytT family response regulator